MDETMQPKRPDRRVLVAGELTDEERERIARAEVPEGHAHLDADLLDTLGKAQTEVRAGKAESFEPKRFRDRLVRIHRGTKR